MFGLFRRKPKYAPLWERHEQDRHNRASRSYDPFTDRPVSIANPEGSLDYTPSPDGMTGTQVLRSPLAAINNTAQMRFGDQASKLANEGNQILDDPNSSKMYKAFQGVLDTEYEQARGNAATNYASNQNSAFGRILGNKEFYQAAQLKAAQPYSFLGSVINPLAQQAIQGQQGLQQVNSSIFQNLNSQFNSAETARGMSTQRRQNFQNNEFARVEHDRVNRLNYSQGQINANAQWRANMVSSGFELLGGVGGAIVGGPKGAMIGSSIGKHIGGSAGQALYPNAGQVPQQQSWGNAFNNSGGGGGGNNGGNIGGNNGGGHWGSNSNNWGGGNTKNPPPEVNNNTWSNFFNGKMAG